MSLRARARSALWRPYQAACRVLDRHVFEYRFNRRLDVLKGAPTAWTDGTAADDIELIETIRARYRRATSYAASGDSMWREFFETYHREIHEALLADDPAVITGFLRNPATCDLFYGFENLSRFLLKGQRLEDRFAAEMALDGLLTLAEALGVRGLENPEGYRFFAHRRPDADEVLAAIDQALGVTVPVPNPYPREYGLKTRRGVVSCRVPQAIYQAWRLRELGGGRILEVGGGLGRTAFYAHVLGLRDYTIVDLPITGVAQGYFLGRVGAQVTLQTPEEFHADTSRFDIVLNVDSLTEMDRAVATRYVEAFKTRARTLLSINHESNGFTAHELLPAHSRHPYWMRRGYVEELVQLGAPA